MEAVELVESLETSGWRANVEASNAVKKRVRGRELVSVAERGGKRKRRWQSWVQAREGRGLGWPAGVAGIGAEAQAEEVSSSDGPYNNAIGAEKTILFLERQDAPASQ